MSRRQKDLNLGPHARAYVTAAALVASAALLGVITFEVIAQAQQTPNETFYMLAGLTFALLWMLSERLLKRTVYGVTLTTQWQNRLTYAIPVGFVASVHLLQDASGLWAVASQLVGGWVICGGAVVLLDVIWDGIKSSFSRSDNTTRLN